MLLVLLLLRLALLVSGLGLITFFDMLFDEWCSVLFFMLYFMKIDHKDYEGFGALMATWKMEMLAFTAATTHVLPSLLAHAQYLVTNSHRCVRTQCSVLGSRLSVSGYDVPLRLRLE